MTTLNRISQVVAVEKQTKARTNRDLSDIYATIQKPNLFAGLSRTYQPKNDEGERFPAESQKVQTTVRDLNDRVQAALVELLNITGTKDRSNQTARTNVVVDGQTIMADAPVTYLLFLEKQLTDLHTFVSKLPVLDPTETWHKNEATGHYATDAVQTVKTKKVPQVLVKAPATDKHPAQVETYMEDVATGYWNVTKFSGAIPEPERARLLAKVEKLQKAVKTAREEANTQYVTEFAPGKAILDFIFA
jgi:hypothetical protein